MAKSLKFRFNPVNFLINEMHTNSFFKFHVFVDPSKHDLRTVLCKNLESIAQDCNLQSRNLNKFCVKQNMIYNPLDFIPLDQE